MRNAYTKHNTAIKTWSTEMMAGFSTFLAMAYTLFIIPTLLHKAGIPIPQAFVTTCCATIIGTLLMSFWGKLPFATGTSIALLIGFAQAIGATQTITLQAMLALIFTAHVLYLILQGLNIRAWMMTYIPMVLQKATTTGIALLIVITAINMGHLFDITAKHSIVIHSTHALGFIVTLLLLHLTHRFLPRAYFLLVMVFMGWFTEWFMPTMAQHIPTLTHATPHWYTLDWRILLESKGWLMLLSLLCINLMDTTFVMELLAEAGGLNLQTGHAHKMKRALISIGIINMICAPFGASTQNTYFENIAGIKAGGRTGKTAAVVALLFALSLFIYPYLRWIPAESIAAGLFFISLHMLHACLKQCDVSGRAERWTTYLTVALIPLTHSIVMGLGIGSLCYALFDLRHKENRTTWQPRYAIYLFFALYLTCITIVPIPF